MTIYIIKDIGEMYYSYFSTYTLLTIQHYNIQTRANGLKLYNLLEGLFFLGICWILYNLLKYLDSFCVCVFKFILETPDHWAKGQRFVVWRPLPLQSAIQHLNGWRRFIGDEVTPSKLYWLKESLLVALFTHTAVMIMKT